MTGSMAARLAKRRWDKVRNNKYLTAPPGLHGQRHQTRIHRLIGACAKVDKRDHQGFAPLHWAAIDGHVGVMKNLLEKRANSDIQDDNGDTPLHIAVRESQHRAVVDLCLEYDVPVKIKTNVGDTGLYTAATFADDVSVVKASTERGADVHATEEPRVDTTIWSILSWTPWDCEDSCSEPWSFDRREGRATWFDTNPHCQSLRLLSSWSQRNRTLRQVQSVDQHHSKSLMTLGTTRLAFSLPDRVLSSSSSCGARLGIRQLSTLSHSCRR